LRSAFTRGDAPRAVRTRVAVLHSRDRSVYVVHKSTMNVAPLFLVPTAIWGSTWLAIKFQLGVVPPGVSVAYRFAVAALLVGLWCAATGRSLAFPRRAHAWFIAQGATMFGLNYVAVYEAELHVPSGLVAVVFSTIVFMSPVLSRLAFGTRIAPRTMLGAVLGVAGVALMFLPELSLAGDGGEVSRGIAWALVATLVAAIGNIVSMRMHRDHLPVLQSTAWGMAYGALLVAGGATLRGEAWTFDPRLPYVASLAYLALFGSVVAFVTYLTLLKKAGPATASFVGVATPVIAMLLTTAFEGYRWTAMGAAGVALAVLGNVIALRSRPARSAARAT
jgi:drug/metabolite transporter (DMT)-like permease